MRGRRLGGPGTSALLMGDISDPPPSAPQPTQGPLRRAGRASRRTLAAVLGALGLAAALLYFLKPTGLPSVPALLAAVTPRLDFTFASSFGSALAAGFGGGSCAGYDPVPAFLEQAEEDYKKHVDERLRRMGTTLPSLADLLKLGDSGLHLPTRQQLEARMLVPTFSCAVEERLGAWGQGMDGKWVCMSHLRGGAPTPEDSHTPGMPPAVSAAPPPPVVVSLRIGSQNTTFEESVFRVLGVAPHLFDPLLSESAPKRPYLTTHDKEAVAGIAGIKVFRSEYPDARWHSVAGLLQLLQANNKAGDKAGDKAEGNAGDKAGAPPLDILALDCGGCEDSVIQELHAIQEGGKGPPRVRQLVVRLTAVNDVALTMRVLLRVEAMGYRQFHAEKDAYNPNHYQVSFIHESVVSPPPSDTPFKKRSASHFLCTDPSSLDKQLRAADCAYARNLRARARQTGGPVPLPSPSDVVSSPRAFGGFTRERFESLMLVPTYSCLQEKRLGVWGEGGKWSCVGFCRPEIVKLPLVVSIGCNGDGSFEAGVFYRLDTIPHTFDPFIPWAAPHMESARHMRFHSLGLTGASRLPELEEKLPAVQWLTVKTMLAYLGVSYVDVFKIDCEGCEFAVVEELGSAFTRQSQPFGQILMEIHDTRNATSMLRLMGTLESLGYRLFHTEVNAYHSQCYEIALVHESLVKA